MPSQKCTLHVQCVADWRYELAIAQAASLFFVYLADVDGCTYFTWHMHFVIFYFPITGIHTPEHLVSRHLVF